MRRTEVNGYFYTEPLYLWQKLEESLSSNVLEAQFFFFWAQRNGCVLFPYSHIPWKFLSLLPNKIHKYGLRVIFFTPSAFYFNLHSLKKKGLHLFSKQCFPADSPIEYKHVSEIWLCQKVRTHFALKKKKNLGGKSDFQMLFFLDNIKFYTFLCFVHYFVCNSKE